MGINISWGTPAGSEEELWGHNVDPHRSPVLQGSDALVSPQTGDPCLFPYHCDPQGQLRQHKHECTGIMLTPWGPQNLHPRGTALGGNAAASTPKKTMLRGDAASTAATTQQAMGSIGKQGGSVWQTAPCLQGWRSKSSSTPNQLNWSGWWEKKASPEQAANTLPNKSLQQRSEDGDGLARAGASGPQDANKSRGSK